MSDLKEYEVVAVNCLKHKVGDIIKLTDKKAKSLVNKVKLVVNNSEETETETKQDQKHKSKK